MVSGEAGAGGGCMVALGLGVVWVERKTEGERERGSERVGEGCVFYRSGYCSKFQRVCVFSDQTLKLMIGVLKIK